MSLLTENAVAIPKPKQMLLPVLVVVFAAYALMTMLIVEQGKSIDLQRGRIGQLFTDSNQVNAMKTSAVRRQIDTQARAEAQTPSSLAAQQDKKGKLQHFASQKPPKDTSDSSDVRRSLVMI